MYNKVLGFKYEEAREFYRGVDTTDRSRKIITIKDCDTEDTFPSTSDIVIYYDIVEDSTPLLLVERMLRSDVSLRKLKRMIKKSNKENECYVFSFNISDDCKFVDITALKRNIYEKLTEV